MGVPGIDPNEQQLEAIADVAHAAAWAGVSTPLIEGLQAQLGGELPNLRTIILIGREAWDNAVKAIVLEGASVTPIAVARLESLRRVARCKLGLCPGDHPESVAEALPWPLGPGGGGGGPTPPPPPLPTPGQSRRIKLSSVLDPTLDADVVPLGRAELDEMHRKHKSSMGGAPESGHLPHRRPAVGSRPSRRIGCSAVRRFLDIRPPRQNTCGETGLHSLDPPPRWRLAAP